MRIDILRKYSYIILITDNKFEEYDVATNDVTEYQLQGDYKEKLRTIKSLLVRYSKKQKKRIIIGEPLIFYKEYYNSSAKMLFDDEEDYVKVKKQSFYSNYNKVSYKYFYKKILDIIEPEEIVDLYKILEDETNGKAENIIVKKVNNKGEFIVFNSFSFSKINLQQLIEIINNEFYTIYTVEKYEILAVYKLPAIFPNGLTVRRVRNFIKEENKIFKTVKKRELMKSIIKKIIQTIVILGVIEIIMIGMEDKSVILNIKNKYFKEIPTIELFKKDFKKLEYRNGKTTIFKGAEND